MSGITLNYVSLQTPATFPSSLKQSTRKMPVPRNRDFEVLEAQQSPTTTGITRSSPTAQVPIQSPQTHSSDARLKENRPSNDGSLFGDDTDDEELPTPEELLSQEPAETASNFKTGRKRSATDAFSEERINESRSHTVDSPPAGNSQDDPIMLDDNGEPGLGESESDWSDNSDEDAGNSTPLSDFSPLADSTHDESILSCDINKLGVADPDADRCDKTMDTDTDRSAPAPVSNPPVSNEGAKSKPSLPSTFSSSPPSSNALSLGRATEHVRSNDNGERSQDVANAKRRKSPIAPGPNPHRQDTASHSGSGINEKVTQVADSNDSDDSEVVVPLRKTKRPRLYRKDVSRPEGLQQRQRRFAPRSSSTDNVSKEHSEFPRTQHKQPPSGDATQSESTELLLDQISALEEQSDSEDDRGDKESEAEGDEDLVAKVAERRRRRLMSAGQISQSPQQPDCHGSPVSTTRDSNERHSRTLKNRRQQISASSHSRRRPRSDTSSNYLSNVKNATTHAETCALPFEGLLGYKVTGSKTLYTLEFTVNNPSPLLMTASIPANFSPPASTGTLNEHGHLSVDTSVDSLKPTRRRSRGLPFSAKEDAMLIDMRERRRLPWKEIKPEFPDRSLASLQVHYSTKLKE